MTGQPVSKDRVKNLHLSHDPVVKGGGEGPTPSPRVGGLFVATECLACMGKEWRAGVDKGENWIVSLKSSPR